MIQLLLSLLLTVFLMVCNWKLFQKAGEKGWKSLIPFYNSYTLYKLVWDTKYFWALIISPILSAIFLLIASKTDGAFYVFCLIVALASVIYMTILGVRSNIKCAKAFGQNPWFGFGLIFLSPIFLPILALGNSSYIGPVLNDDSKESDDTSSDSNTI